MILNICMHLFSLYWDFKTRGREEFSKERKKTFDFSIKKNIWDGGSGGWMGGEEVYLNQ